MFNDLLKNMTKDANEHPDDDIWVVPKSQKTSVPMELVYIFLIHNALPFLSLNSCDGL